MKTSRIVIAGFVVTAIMATPAFAWVQLPTDATGWYYGYDDLADGPPFAWPELPPLPSYKSIHDNLDAVQHPPFNDKPFAYSIEDSFWYYHHWYVPGDTLYISPDGWMSFDPVCTTGFPYPPSAAAGTCPYTNEPNELVAVLWQDNDPTGGGPYPEGENRVHHLYVSYSKILSVEWYRVHAFATDNVFTYMTTLQLGGQVLLATDDCGVLYSKHFIHFFYDTADDWNSEDGGAGIEDIYGEHGLSYHEVDDEEIHDGGVVRFGYRFIRSHDVAVLEITDPHLYVEAETDIDPKAIIINIGKENEVFDISLQIYPEESDTYDYTISGYTLRSNLGPDTVEFPIWTSGEAGKTYTAEFIHAFEGDQCPANDTCRKYITTLYSHDVGVVELTNLEGHDWGNSHESPYPAGTEYTCVATVENFGANAEDSFYLDLQVHDMDTDTEIWWKLQLVEFIDWRGNDEGNPYVKEYTFPTFTQPDEHWYRFECRAEMIVDNNPSNDGQERHINVGITEDPADYIFALEDIGLIQSSGTISFSLGQRAMVSLKVYSVDGQLIKTLTDESKQAGRYEVEWNDRDEDDCDIPNGVYLFRMEVEGWSDVEKVLIVK